MGRCRDVGWGRYAIGVLVFGMSMEQIDFSVTNIISCRYSDGLSSNMSTDSKL
jgi:uncharacterized membrane protein YidH (DUF202 family)